MEAMAARPRRELAFTLPEGVLMPIKKRQPKLSLGFPRRAQDRREDRKGEKFPLFPSLVSIYLSPPSRDAPPPSMQSRANRGRPLSLSLSQSRRLTDRHEFWIGATRATKDEKVPNLDGACYIRCALCSLYPLSSSRKATYENLERGGKKC